MRYFQIRSLSSSERNFIINDIKIKDNLIKNSTSIFNSRSLCKPNNTTFFCKIIKTVKFSRLSEKLNFQRIEEQCVAL